METAAYRIYPISEKALTIELGHEIRKDINRLVIACKELILQRPFAGLIEVVPAYTTVTVFYDQIQVLKHSSLPGETPNQKVQRYLTELITQLKETEDTEKSSVISIPVCYDEEFALDLVWLADFHKTSKQEIIKHHTGHEYTVFMIGFAPGFPYLGVLPAELESPRKQNPRTVVPAGSVGIAGLQTGIYPYATPGGWQIIGRTPIRLFTPANAQPSLLKAGDRVHFKPISKEEFNKVLTS